jgi:hypothetical protein
VRFSRAVSLQRVKLANLTLINDPVLIGFNITLELPNEGSKLDFEKELSGLLDI